MAANRRTIVEQTRTRNERFIRIPANSSKSGRTEYDYTKRHPPGIGWVEVGPTPDKEETIWRRERVIRMQSKEARNARRGKG